MARFEQDPDQGYRPWSIHDDEDSSQPDTRPGYMKAAGRRIMPRLRLPRFIRKRLPELPEEARYRLQVVMGLAQAVFAVILTFGAIALLISVLSTATIREPSSAAQVFEPIEDPADVSWSVETVRVKSIDGARLRVDSLRGFQVDLKRNKFRIQASGLTETTFRMSGDGKIALYSGGESVPYRLRTYPSPQSLRPLLPKEMEKLSERGRIVTNQATVGGKRGWLLTWAPNREALLRLLSVEALSLEGKDIDAIRQGKFEVVTATATVSRSPRQLRQIYTQIKVNGADLRILASYRAYDLGNLEALDFSKSDFEEEQ